MGTQERRWVRVKKLTAEEKAAIAAACERMMAECLRPRFLPEIIPTAHTYPVGIAGKWQGSKYSFITRFRSGFADSRGEEFDAPFARLDHIDEHIPELRFDVMWYRHTGRWWLLHQSVTLDEALTLVATDPVLRPLI